MKLPTDPAYYMRLAEREGDATIGAGVPTDRDALWNCQLLAAAGIEATNDTGPLADLFAAIHRICASQLSGNAPVENGSNAS